MNELDLPDIGECVVATFRCFGSHVLHAFMSRAVDGGDIVWCRNYSPPRWDQDARRWQSEDAEHDNEYKVVAWVRLPEPPTITTPQRGREETE